MNNNHFNAAIEVAVSPHEAFKNINNVSEWWLGQMEGRSQNLNDVFSMHFGETFVTHKIVEIIPDEKVVWQVTDCNLHWINNKKEWVNTKMIFEVIPNGNKTKVSFTHEGLVPNIECYNDCSKGWSHYIKESLFSLITTGKGKRENE